MSQVYSKMKIEVKGNITDIITAKQNDSNSRFLDVYLYDDGTQLNLTGTEVRIYMRKPDGSEIFNNGTITEATNGRCQFELTSQALGAYGILKAEISVWKNNTEILTTQTFDIFVTESLRTSGSVESSNEYGALVVLFQNLYESMDLMTDMVKNFGAPSEIAQSFNATTFWQMLEKVAQINQQALENASVSEVLNRIGESTDTAAEPTVFGGIGYLRINRKVRLEYTGSPQTFTVPQGVTEIFITACGGGGAGKDQTRYAGGGAQSIIHKKFSVIPGTIINITIGQGAQTNAINGENTIIGNLITLIGGNSATDSASGASVGIGSGKGGTGYTSGNMGASGGGSLGRGGSSGSTDGSANGGNPQSNGSGLNGGDGYMGSGGGSANNNIAGKGGDGVVIIEW